MHGACFAKTWPCCAEALQRTIRKRRDRGNRGIDLVIKFHGRTRLDPEQCISTADGRGYPGNIFLSEIANKTVTW